MNLSTTYQGAQDPFEGDRTIWLRSLPAGARVTTATVTLTPQNGPQFLETFTFNTVDGSDELPADDWGVSRTEPGSFVEIDFHARRTLAEVQGEQEGNVKEAKLQVDMGGAYVGIADDGTFMTPEKTPWSFTLSSTPAGLPGLAVTKFSLRAMPDDAELEPGTLEVTKVTIRSVPTNLSVRLGDMPPFWTRLGQLPTAETSPDFAAVLNAFLAEASVENGFYAVPLVVHSDTIARLDVTLTVNYVVERPLLPDYLPEVTIPYGYSSLPGVEKDLLTVDLPRQATPIAGTGGAVQGTFDASRVVFGEIGESEAMDTVTVSPDRTLAQPIQLADETPVSGIDLPLANTEPGLAGLHLALQADADGKPSGQVLTSAEVTVEKPVPGGSAWGSAALPSEFRLLPGRRYWLVLQTVAGQAYWDVAPGDPAAPDLQASTDGGFSWRTAASEAGEKPLAAIYRLRHTPERFTMPVQLEVGEGSDAVRARFDRFAPLGRVEFDVDLATELREYVASPSMASPCGSGNLLVNGGFDQPPLIDATPLSFQSYLSVGIHRVGLHSISKHLDRVEPSVWFKAEVPDGWQGEANRVIRVKIKEWMFVLLVPPSFLEKLFASDDSGSETVTLDSVEPAELVQHIPVAGGCAYLLRFLYAIEAQTEVSLPPSFSRWQIRWLDDTGQTLATDGGALIGEELPEQVRQSPVYEARVVAPEGATEAELRFTQRPPGILALEDASFKPTLETLSNGNFQRWDAKSDPPSPVDWARSSGLLDPELDGETGQVIGAKLKGGGPEDAVLVQTTEAVAGEHYELQVRARPARTPDDAPEALADHQRARLELHWLTDDGAIGEPVILHLDGRDFPTRAWAGSAPDGTTRAEIRLVQPQGRGDLLVESVSLSRVDLVSVPLTFLAEAPGELTVSDLRVTYDPPAPPELPAPPQRLRRVEEARAVYISPLAERSVSIIAGVGDRFSALLDEHSITTLVELAALDPGVEIEGVSYGRRLEFKAAAEMIMGIHVETAPFARVGNESLEDLVTLTPAELARRAKQPLQRAAQLQRDLRGLRFLLDNDTFRSLRLSDLMPAAG